MDLPGRNQSVRELKSQNAKLIFAVLGLVVVLVLLSLKLAFQSEVVVEQTPGMPNNSVIEKTGMDKSSQKATLIALTSAIAQVNPSNAPYQKEFIQCFLSAAAYTRVSKNIDDEVAKLVDQHELGSHYFVFIAYEYDPVMDKHFVIGDVHTVNAAKDTSQRYVYEYPVHFENYRLWADDVLAYEGEKPHDTEWAKANKKT
jgi:hypothetical protein